MNNPFTPPDGPFTARPGFAFGIVPGPAERRALHGARRHARREFFENLRDHAGEHDGPFSFGPGFGPGFGSGFGSGFGFGGPRVGRRRGRPGRGRRGDVRAAILVLLGERPMPGY